MRERLAHEMCLTTHMQADIVVHGLDPVDVRGTHEHDPTVSFDGQARDARMPRSGCRGDGRRHFCDESGQARTDGPIFLVLRGANHALLRAVDRLQETIAIDGLENVIGCVHVKCPYGVRVGGRHKNDRWHAVGSNRPHDSEPVDLGHSECPATRGLVRPPRYA